MDWGLLIATVVGGLLALLGSFIMWKVQNSKNNKEQKRKDKMEIFTELVSGRGFSVWSYEAARKLNLIPIVFSENEEVIKAFNLYHLATKVNFSKSCYTEEGEFKDYEELFVWDQWHYTYVVGKIKARQIMLLKKIAEELGYKNGDVIWEWVGKNDPFIQDGLSKNYNANMNWLPILMKLFGQQNNDGDKSKNLTTEDSNEIQRKE